MPIARLDFIRADRIYQSNAAATFDDSEACNNLPRREDDEIEEELSEIVPETFDDAMGGRDRPTKSPSSGNRGPDQGPVCLLREEAQAWLFKQCLCQEKAPDPGRGTRPGAALDG